MSLVRCQIEPRLRALDTDVVACHAVDGGFRVRLSDTILYPEGGGQPADHGHIDRVPVGDVQRDGDAVWHHTAADLPLGPARVTVDWDRRFDHMQQHTAQHLLSAVAHDRLQRPTVAFHLGALSCTVDMAGLILDLASQTQLQRWVNEAIREARPVQVHVLDRPAYDAFAVRSRGLPDGHTGDVRVVEIDGLDRNTCGGTHVAHLGELQAVAITRVERVKGGSRVHYLAGGRVVARLAETLDRERVLTDLLTAAPADHAASVARMMADGRAAAKTRKGLMLELSGLLGRQLADDGGAVAHLHRPGADLAVLRGIADASLSRRPEQTLLLTGDGVFLVAGPPDIVSAVGPQIASAVGGRGGGRGGRYQGKATNLDDAANLVHLLASPT